MEISVGTGVRVADRPTKSRKRVHLHSHSNDEDTIRYGDARWGPVSLRTDRARRAQSAAHQAAVQTWQAEDLE